MHWKFLKVARYTYANPTTVLDKLQIMFSNICCLPLFQISLWPRTALRWCYKTLKSKFWGTFFLLNSRTGKAGSVAHLITLNNNYPRCLLIFNGIFIYAWLKLILDCLMILNESGCDIWAAALKLWQEQAVLLFYLLLPFPTLFFFFFLLPPRI